MHDFQRGRATLAPASVHGAVIVLAAILAAGCATNTPVATHAAPVSSSGSARSTIAPIAAPTAGVAAQAGSTPPSGWAPVVATDAVIVDSGLRPVDGVDFSGGVISAIAAGDHIWLASPGGLARIDPKSNTAAIVDRDPGANISAAGEDLWRTGFLAGTVTRYDLGSARRTLTEAQPGTLNIFATNEAIWISLHWDGKVRRLDPKTGKTTGTTVVSTPECCGAAQFARVGSRLYVTVTKDGTIVGLDPATAKVVDRHKLAQTCDGLSLVAGYLWTCWIDPAEQDQDQFAKVQRVNPASFSSTQIEVGLHDGLPGEVGGEAWIPVRGRLVHLDSRTGRPDRELQLGVPGYVGSNLLEAFGSIWVTSRTDPRVVRIPADALEPAS